MGLERAAVWSAAQVKMRLLDAFSGRTNMCFESLRVKLSALQRATNEIETKHNTKYY